MSELSAANRQIVDNALGTIALAALHPEFIVHELEILMNAARAEGRQLAIAQSPAEFDRRLAELDKRLGPHVLYVPGELDPATIERIKREMRNPTVVITAPLCEASSRRGLRDLEFDRLVTTPDPDNPDATGGWCPGCGMRVPATNGHAFGCPDAPA